MIRAMVIGLVFCVAAGSLVAQTEGDALKPTFADANALYEAGDYSGAIQRYESLVGAGVDDPALYYNTANAYYKVQDFGHAVLYYERALRLVPRDRDIRENLELVESQLIDKQFVGKGNRLVRTFSFLHDNLSAAEMFMLSSVFYVSLCLLGIGVVFRDTRIVGAIYGRMSVLSPGRLIGLTRTQDMWALIVIVGFLFGTTAVSVTDKHRHESRRDQAVIVAKEVAVYSSPTRDATLEFKLHEGTRVSIEQGRANWAKVRLPGGLDGWVEAAATKRI